MRAADPAVIVSLFLFVSSEETAAVVSLFQYWITDILPMQRDKKTGLSTMDPADFKTL